MNIDIFIATALPKKKQKIKKRVKKKGKRKTKFNSMKKSSHGLSARSMDTTKISTSHYIHPLTKLMSARFILSYHR